MVFEEGVARRTRQNPTNDANQFDVVPSGVDDARISPDPILLPESPNSPANQPQAQPLLNADQETTPPTGAQPTPPTQHQPNSTHTETLPTVRRSDCNRKPTTRLLESEAAKEREIEAKKKGKAWANKLPADKQPLALIVQNPWAFASSSSEYWVPTSYMEAMKRPDLWWEPMQAEYDLLMEKGVWELVELPPGANVTGGKWTYAIKWGSRGEVIRRKG